jgi:hypothetical protein
MERPEHERGSAKLLTAWKERRTALTDEEVNEIAAHLDESPAAVGDINFFGADETSGMTLSLAYYDDDIHWCGNDLTWLLKLKEKLGGTGPGPIVIINGFPAVDRALFFAAFGNVAEGALEALADKHLAAGPRR